MSVRDEIQETFPELVEIKDDRLRSGIIDAWAIALEENGVPISRPSRDLVPTGRRSASRTNCCPTTSGTSPQPPLGSRGRSSIEGTRSSTSTPSSRKHSSTTSANSGKSTGMSGHGSDSCSVTLSTASTWSVRPGYPSRYSTSLLSHTPATPVDPATPEADIVMGADGATASAIRSRAFDDIRDAPTAGSHL